MRTLPTSLVLVPTARPCALVVEGDKVKWEPTGKARDLEQNEVEEAMRCLGETVALVGFAALSEETLHEMFAPAPEKLAAVLEERNSLKALQGFAAAYGYLVPRHEIGLPALRQYCLELGYVASLLILILEGHPLAAIWLENMLPEGKAPYYKLHITADFRLEWKPHQKKPDGVYFARPGIFDTPEQAAAYAKEQLRRILAGFLSQWPPRFHATPNGLELRITHLLPYYLTGLLNMELHLCPCGCGRLVGEGKKYFEEACYRKVLNGRPHRKIASWLRTMKHRGKLGEAEYRSLVEKAKGMLREGRTENEVRAKIELLLAGK